MQKDVIMTWIVLILILVFMIANNVLICGVNDNIKLLCDSVVNQSVTNADIYNYLIKILVQNYEWYEMQIQMFALMSYFYSFI